MYSIELVYRMDLGSITCVQKNKTVTAALWCYYGEKTLQATLKAPSDIIYIMNK